MTPLAHAGGWDEILLFLSVPLAWVLFLLVRGGIQRIRGRNEPSERTGRGSG